MDGNGQRKGVHRGRTRGSKNLHEEEVRRALVASHGSISSAARRLGSGGQSVLCSKRRGGHEAIRSGKRSARRKIIRSNQKRK